MTQRFLIALVIAAMAVAACKGGSTSPTPSSTPYSPTPNPKIMKATVEVTINGTPRPRIPVEESTPRNKESPRPGKTIETLLTGKKGIAHFNGLKPSQVYCWVAILGPSQKSTECAGWAVWQSGDILLGT